MSQISSLISPISLPEPGQTPTSDVVTILGWGKQGDTGGVSPDLKYVQVSRISSGACSEYYGPLAPGTECVTGPSTCQVTPG